MEFFNQDVWAFSAFVLAWLTAGVVAFKSSKIRFTVAMLEAEKRHITSRALTVSYVAVWPLTVVFTIVFSFTAFLFNGADNQL